MQIVPAIADKVTALHVFQRTPPWITPSPKYFLRVPEGHHWLVNHLPFYREWIKFRMAWLSYERLFPTLWLDESWPHPERAINAKGARTSSKRPSRIILRSASVCCSITAGMPH
jgi:4-hydroxyacetophenone monooxygenase